MGTNLVVTGMVLNTMPIGEYDKRITLLTKERGKLAVFARGARRPNSQLLAACSPFSFGEFELFEGRSTYTVAKAAISNYFRELAMDPDAAYYGFYFLEFAEYCCQENNDEKEMLKLLYQSLRALESEYFGNSLVRSIFELRALAANGEAPNVFQCLGCGTQEELHWFSVKCGGILCGQCRGKAADARQIEEATLYTMQFILSAAAGRLYTFNVSDRVLRELRQILQDYMDTYVTHAFKSLKVLEEMNCNDFTG